MRFRIRRTEVEELARSALETCEHCGLAASWRQEVQESSPSGYPTGKQRRMLVCDDHRATGWTLVRQEPVGVAN